MKKVILISIAFMLFFAITVKAQIGTTTTPGEGSGDMTVYPTVTVKDTTFKEDARLNYIGNTILPATIKFIEDYNRQAKVAGDSLTYKAETNQLLRKFEKAVNEYATAFMVVKDIQVNPTAIEKEFNDLNAKIEALQKDPEIKYIEAMSEFQRIQKRQQVLAKYYQQIVKQ